MSEVPADPFRSGDAAANAVRDGAVILAALGDCAAEDGGARGRARPRRARPDDLLVALLVAVIERYVNRSRPPRILRLPRLRPTLVVWNAPSARRTDAA